MSEASQHETAASYFAPAERADEEQLRRSLEVVSKNPVIDGVLEVVSGLLAVLNEHRQILVVNERLLALLGVPDAGKVLGLRPGEAIGCTHAEELPGGCGTSRFCSTCGAAIAIVTSLGSDRPVERECAITVDRAGKPLDLYFQVRCCPMTFQGERFLLLFLRETSAEQWRAALERVFFHDVNNTLNSLAHVSLQLKRQESDPDRQQLATRIEQLAWRLAKEVAVQRTLSLEPSVCPLNFREIALDRLIGELEETFADHPAAEGKLLRLPEKVTDLTLSTDPAILHRILMNMLINAFEATEPGGEVRLSVEAGQGAVTFAVWSRPAIPAEVARRIFQRNFSTKPGAGRGLGTFAMRLLGETFLQGKVSFTTSEIDGTLFRFTLPVAPCTV